MLVLPFLLGASGIVLAEANYKYVNNGESALKHGAQVIDVRSLEQCLKKSVRLYMEIWGSYESSEAFPCSLVHLHVILRHV